MNISSIRQLHFALALTTLAIQAAAYAGGTSSGGGTAALEPRSGRWALLDLLFENPQFDPMTSDPILASDWIAPTPFSRTAGYDRIAIQKAPGFASAMRRLDIWQANSPALVSMIRSALLGMDWIFTPFQQELCKPESLPRAYGPFQSAVVYHETFGARMSLPVINRLGHTSLTALLIHEALRHMSIAYQEQMTDTAIFETVAKIVLTDPKSGDWLDLHASGLGTRVTEEIDVLQQEFRVFGQGCAALSENGLPDESLCQGSSVKPGQLIPPLTDDQAQAKRYFDQMLQLDGDLVNVIVNSSPEINRRSNPQVQHALEARGALEMVLNTYVSESMKRAAERLVDDARMLNGLFGRMGEDKMRRYISGDHSGYNVFQRWKLQGAIRKAQRAITQGMNSGTLLACPGN